MLLNTYKILINILLIQRTTQVSSPKLVETSSFVASQREAYLKLHTWSLWARIDVCRTIIITLRPFDNSISIFRKRASNSKNYEGNNKFLSEVWTCLECSSLWRKAKSNLCKPSLIKRSMNDSSLPTSSRNRHGMLEPTEVLYKFGEWVLERFIHLLSLSFVRLSPLPVMMELVHTAYCNNRYDPPKLPDCHPVAKFIISRIGKRMISVYCARMASSKRGYYISLQF